jgi:hypothetical protein
MNFMNKKDTATKYQLSMYIKLIATLLFVYLFLPFSSAFALDYFWVGGSGNWGDLTKWATTSGGGTFHTALPSIGDDVFFDINSFPSPISKTVTIDVNAECKNMSWAGVTNTPILTGTNAFTLTIYGNLNFVAAMSNTFAGKFIFSAITAGQTITSAGQTFQNVDFTVSTLTGGSILQDNFIATGTINLLEGTLNTNGVTVTCNNFTAANTPKVRTLNLTNSAFNVTGAGTPLDFRGDDANFALISNAISLITLSNAAPITVITGLATKTIPSMIFTNSPTVTLATESGGGAGTITFGNISINQNGANLTVNGDCVKNYGNIAMGNAITAVFNGNNAVYNTFNGTVTFGNNANVAFGNNNTFNQNIVLGNNTALLSFTASNIFSANLTVGTTSNVVFSGTSNLFTGMITLADFSEIIFSNTGTNNFNNASIGQGVVWKFSTTATNNINGTFTTTANCNNLILITSNVTGLQGSIAVANTQTWNFVTARDLNKTGAGVLTVVNGADAGNNAAVGFTSAPRILFWVGNSGDWNNSANWSLTSGGAGGQCPPTSIDDVIFDASSFGIGGQSVNMNINAFCRNMTWATVTNNPKMLGTNQLNISGSLTLAPTMLQTGTATDFSGDVFFSSTVAGNTITMSSKAFNNVRFEGLGGSWQLNDAATVLNNLDIFAGNLTLNNQTLNAGRLSTAATVDAARGIDFTSSTVTLNGNGTALNLGGTAVTVNEGTSTINLNNNGTITVEVGATTKTIPHLIFTDTDATTRTITVNTPSNASTITFKNIEVRKQRFVMNGTSQKIFNGTLLFFNEVACTFNGSPILTDNIFNNTLTFQGRNTTDFNIGATFNQNVTFLDGINLGSDIEFRGNINFPNPGTVLFFGNNINATFTGQNVFRNMTVGTNSYLIFDERGSSFDNLSLSGYTSVRFAQNQTTTFNQILTAFVSCDSWISLGSSVNGSAANLNFIQAQTWQGVIVRDIDASLGTMPTANNSSSGGNNTNINFVFLNPPKTLYWIGGALGDWSDGSKWSFSSGGVAANCVPTPNDDVIFDNNSFPVGGGTVSLNLFLMFCRNMTWTNTNAGTLIGTEKILQVYGSIVFNGVQTINNYSGNIEFWGNSIPTTKNITSNGTPFFGPVLFNNNDTWVLQDALDLNNNAPLLLNYGVLDMNNRNITIEGNWTVSTPALGSGFAQATFLSGTNTITFDGKTNVQTIRIPELTGVSCVECSCSTSPFNNLIVDKSTSLVGRRLDLQTSISIKNDFMILTGDVWDNGFQIRGNAVGTFTMANNTALRLGSAAVSTVFPTCFPNISISAGTTAGLVSDEFNIVLTGSNPAIVEYRSSQHQLVKNTTYGTLLLTNPNTSASRNRLLQGGINVNGSLIIGPSIWLKDMGFQIVGNANSGNKIYVDAGSVLSLGTGSVASAAVFALGYATGSTDYAEITTLPLGISLPPAVPTNANTTFPTFTPVGDFLVGTGKMQVEGAVSYTAGTPIQSVLAGFTYKHLYAYGTAFSGIREVVGAAGAELKTTGNFLISSNVSFKDKGFQIDGTGNLFLQSGAELWIGEGTKATKFPPNLPLTGMNLAVSSQVRYNADVPQEVSTRPAYQSLWLTAPGVTSGTPVPKTMVPTAPVRLGSYSYIAPYNNLIDNGSQIYSNVGYKQFFIDPNSVITLGNVAIATNLPINFDWIFQPNSTVVYNSNQLQRIDILPVGRRFENLTISTSSATPLGIKELQAGTGINNNLLIKTNNTLNDKGFQIGGNAVGTLTMESQSILILGSAATATGYPSTYPRANNNLDVESTVIYTADPNQTVTFRPVYGNLIIRKVNANLPVSTKSIFSPSGGLSLETKGNLTVESFNNFADNGISIIGTGTGKTLLLQNNAQLTLGRFVATAVATLFPNQFATIDLSPNTTPSSTVTYNASVVGNNITGQNNIGNPFSYGNLTLFSNGTAVTKNLLSNINVRRNLTINTNNTLNATGTNYNINIGGNWLNAGGVFNAQAGKVTFDGTVNQNITSNNSHFFSMEFTNPQGVTMQDAMTVGGIVTFTNGLVNNLSGQIMTFKSGATVAATPGTFPGAPGPSNDSFVNGTVRKIGNQAFIFPIGKAVGADKWFAPLGTSAPTSTTAQFSATYVPQNPHPLYNRNLREPTFNHISEAEYWLLNREVGTDNIQVRLSWDTPRSGGINIPPALLVAHWRSAAPLWWANGGNDSWTGDATRGTVLSSVVFDNFSPFTLGSITQNNPLPIELVNFIATPNYGRKAVDLRWQTASETNNDFFTLEKSRNGKDFRPFVTIPSKAEAGNSQQLLSYQAHDNEPFSGISYYRLKQTDFDGTGKYSKIVPLHFEQITVEDRFIVYPNPTEGSLLNVQFLDSQIKNGTIIIYDLLGKLMLYQAIENQSNDLLGIQFQEKLPIGSYLIKIVANEKVYIKKFSVL